MVFKRFAGEVGLIVGECEIEIGNGVTLAVTQVAFDLVDQEGFAPAVLHAFAGVEESFFGFGEAVEEDNIVCPGELADQFGELVLQGGRKYKMLII